MQQEERVGEAVEVGVGAGARVGRDLGESGADHVDDLLFVAEGDLLDLRAVGVLRHGVAEEAADVGDPGEPVVQADQDVQDVVHAVLGAGGVRDPLHVGRSAVFECADDHGFPTGEVLVEGAQRHSAPFAEFIDGPAGESAFGESPLQTGGNAVSGGVRQRCVRSHDDQR